MKPLVRWLEGRWRDVRMAVCALRRDVFRSGALPRDAKIDPVVALRYE